jgi:hypothetical protein
MVADWFSEADVRGIVFVGGQVDRGDIPVTEDEIKQIAEKCRTRYRTDYALAIGPFPVFPMALIESQHVHFAIAAESGVLAKTALFAGHPDLLKQLTAKRALNYLRLHLLGK